MSVAHAFPEMIRHGYTSCVACHVSPAGGGLLTSYGRTISRELLSRWGGEGEEQIFHGALTEEKVRSWLDGSRDRGFNLGGDVRFLQTRTETKTFKQGRFLPMQRDVELAARIDRFTAVGSYGFEYLANARDELKFRRYYGLWSASDNLYVKFGKFIPAYGLMLSDHYLSIKQGHQLGLGSERNAIEAHWVSEFFNVNLSASRADAEPTALREERALAASFNYNIAETYQIGVHYWQGSLQSGRRDITGATALLGFTKSFYSLTELDLLVTVPNGTERTKGLRYFERIGFEVTRGVHLLAQWDGSQSDLKNGKTRYQSPGVGINFYPRPHFELQMMWTRPQFAEQPAAESAFVVGHYYL